MRKDLSLIFSLQFEHTVNRDNTVSFQNLTLQIERVNWRGTLAGCIVLVHQHLDRTLSITHGPHRLGHYSAQGEAIPSTQNAASRAVEKTRRGKVQKQTFPPRLEIPQRARDSHSSGCCWRLTKPDISLATKTGHFNLLRTLSLVRS